MEPVAESLQRPIRAGGSRDGSESGEISGERCMSASRTMSKRTIVLLRPSRRRSSRPDSTNDPRGPLIRAERTRPVELVLRTRTPSTPPVSLKSR